MKFLADTNIISEVRKGTRCDENVARWYSQVGETEIFISVITLGEIRKGIEQLRQRGDTEQTAMLERWLHQVRERFSDRIQPITSNIADTWGRISSIRSIPVSDGLMAATAIYHDLTLATRNLRGRRRPRGENCKPLRAGVRYERPRAHRRTRDH